MPTRNVTPGARGILGASLLLAAAPAAAEIVDTKMIDSGSVRSSHRGVSQDYLVLPDNRPWREGPGD